MGKNNYPCRIEGIIDAKGVELGVGCVVESGAWIFGKNCPAINVKLGDFCHIAPGVSIVAPEFELGDYSRIHSNTVGRGKQALTIGRNCLIGSSVMLDCMGGLTIDDNVGIGSHSQVRTLSSLAI